MVIKLGANTYKIEFDYNAMCEIEDLCGMSVYQLALNDKRLGLGAIRAFLKGGLSMHHPEINLTEVGVLIQDHIKTGKNLDGLINQLTLAMKQSGLLTDADKNYRNIEKKSQYHGGKR